MYFFTGVDVFSFHVRLRDKNPFAVMRHEFQWIMKTESIIIASHNVSISQFSQVVQKKSWYQIRRSHFDDLTCKHETHRKKNHLLSLLAMNLNQG